MSKLLPPLSKEENRSRSKQWARTPASNKEGRSMQQRASLPAISKSQGGNNQSNQTKKGGGIHRMKSQRILPPINQKTLDKDTLKELQKLVRPVASRGEVNIAGSTPTTPDNEIKFCKNYHRAMKDNNLLKQAIALQQLGDLHRQRAKEAINGDDVFNIDGTDDVLKAVAAYMGAMSRTGHFEQRQSLMMRIKEVEASYIEMYRMSVSSKGFNHANNADPQLHPNTMDKHMKKLDKFREFVRKRLNRIQDMWKHKFVEQERVATKGNDIEVLKEALNLGNKVKNEMRTLFKDIVNDCVHKLGEAPCKYAIVGVADIAMGYITPYSDFQYFILTKSPDLEAKEYFKYLATLINIHVMMLGETPLTATILRVIQDPFNKMIHSIMDDSSSNGIKIDISLASTSINPFLFKYSKHILECNQDIDLIKTPGDMVRFLYMLHDNDLQLFVLKMYQNMLITGDNELFIEYRDMVEDYFIPKQFKQEGRIQTDSAKVLQFILNFFEVNFYVDLHHNQVNLSLARVCNDVKMISSLVYCLKFLFCLTSKTPLAIIEELRLKGYITEDGEAELKTLLCVGYYLHLRTVSEKNGQNVSNGLFNYNPDTEETIDVINNVFSAKNEDIFLRMYGILDPLLKSLQGFYKKADQKSILKYMLPKENLSKYYGYPKLAKYAECVEAAKNYLLDKTLSLSTLDEFKLYSNLGLTALKCYQTKDANLFFTHAMEIKDGITENEQDKTFAFITTWHNMGLVHLYEERFSKAITFFEESIELGNEMGGKNMLKTEKGREFLAMVYSSVAKARLQMWNLHEAAKHLKKAIDTLGKLRHTTQHLCWKRNLTSDLAHVKIILGSSKDALSLIKLVLEYDATLRDIHCPQIQFASTLHLMALVMKTMGKAVQYEFYSMYSQRMAIFVTGQKVPNFSESVFSDISEHDVLNILRVCRDVTKHMDKNVSLKYSKLICALHFEDLLFHKTSNIELALDKLSHGNILTDLQLHEEAKDTVVSSLSLIEQTFGKGENNIIRASALKQTGLCLLNTGHSEQALRQFKQAFNAFSMSNSGSKIPEQLKVLEHIAEAYRKMRIYDEAAKSWEDCIAYRKQLFGPVHLVVAYSLRKQGLLLQEMMEYEGAVSSIQSSLDMYRRIHGHGKKHPDVAQLHFDIGKLYCDIFEHEKAEYSLTKALEIKRFLCKDKVKDQDLIDILVHLGNFYRIELRVEEAITLHKEGIDVASELFANKGKILAKIHACLAEDYQVIENYEESSTAFEIAIEMHREDAGFENDNLDVANWLRELGRAYEILGIRDKAQQCHKRSLEIKEQFMGKEAADADLLESLFRLAERHESKGDYKRAIPLRKQFILKQKAIEGSELQVIRALHALSNDYLQTGEHEFSQGYNTQLLNLLRDIYGSETVNSEIADAVHNAGFIFETMGRVPKAIKLYEEALRMYKILNEEGDYNELIGITMTNLGNSMNTAGKQEAVVVLQGAVDLLNTLQLVGEKRNKLARAYYCLGLSYEVYPKYEMAVLNHQLAFEIREELCPQMDDRNIAESLRALGRSYCQLKFFEKGIPLLEKSFSIMRNMRDNEKMHVVIEDAHVLLELGQSYTDSGDPAEGIAMYKQSLDIMYAVYGRHKPHLKVAQCLGLIAEAAAKQESGPEKAINYAVQSMKVYKTVLRHVNDHPIYGHLTELIADVHLSEKNYEKAVSFYRKAAQLYLSLHQGNALALDVTKTMLKIKESEKMLNTESHIIAGT